MPITKKVNSNANVKQFSDADLFNHITQVAGSNSGGINYINNPGAETDTSGWAAYQNTAQATPVTGTGGSPVTSLSRTTSGPLRGTGSFLITKDAANRQGEGVSYDFSIDDADRAKVLSIQFDYILASGSFNAGSPSTDSDIEMWVYDKTNAKLIPVTPFKLVSNSSVDPESFKGTFQTSANSTSYRLILHIATTNASAWAFKFDNVVVGPQAILNAPNLGDWTFYTPATTQGFGTVTGLVAKYRIVGDSVEINVVFVTGTVTASQARFGLPPGMTADPAKVTGLELVGTAAAGNNGDAYYTVLCNGNYTYVTFGIQQATRNSLTEYNGSDIVGSTTSWGLWATIPIAGLSSNTLTGNDADARVVDAHIGLTSNYAVTANNVVKFDTVIFDSHNAYNPATGQYKVPVSGKYEVKATGITTATNGSLYAVKNGVHGDFLTTLFTGEINSGSTEIDCVAGDLLQVNCDSSLTVTGNTPFESHVTFKKVSGPALPLATETIACRYRQDNAQSVAQGNLTSTNLRIIDFNKKDYDTHGAVTTGSNWVFTAPRSDWYQVDVNGSLHFTNNGSSPFTMIVRLIKNPNGSPVEMNTKSLGLPVVTGGNAWERSIGDKIFLLAGEQLQVTIAHNSDAGGTIVTSTSANWFGADTNNTISISTKG